MSAYSSETWEISFWNTGSVDLVVRFKRPYTVVEFRPGVPRDYSESYCHCQSIGYCYDDDY